MIALPDKDFGTVKETFERSRAASTEHIYQRSWRQNCMPV